MNFPINSGAGGRRILHQPFFPGDSSPPPPSPENSPFFPTYPSPPPPPSASALASFPANISSLPIPHSSTSSGPRTSVSPALIAITVALSVCAIAATVFSLFLYFRARRRTSDEDDVLHDKPSVLSRSGGLAPPPVPPGAPPRIQRNSANNSTEFLYLGTMVNSRAINGGQVPMRPGFDPRKTDSPDLHPLPPLAKRNIRQDMIGNSGTLQEDEEESFYSPRGSASGRESSLGVGSGSGTVFVAVQNNANSSAGSSSSETVSPARSASLSISPPVTDSTKSSKPKSPLHPPPERDLEAKTKEEEAEESPLLSSSSEMSTPVESPTLSPIWAMAGKSSPSPPHAGDWSVFDRNQLSPISDRSTPSHKSLPIILPRFLGRGWSKKASPESAKISNSTLSSPESIASPISRVSQSSSSKISYSPPRPPPPPPPPPPAIRRSESPISPWPVSKPSREVESENQIRVLESTNGEAVYANSTTPKPKLKPLHWDKVRASSDREMVWDQLRCSSFEVNEEMIETLFIVNKPKEMTAKAFDPSPREANKVLDPKKAQNIAISLRALSVTVEEVSEALLEGSAEMLGTELLESLLKMAPTKEEEWKLREYKDDSPCKLGHAERFLKTLIDIPFAFKRLEAMLYVSNFESEVEYLKKSFETLENACDELRNSRMFLKLLEAVLKTGNRMNVGTNRGDAHAFKLDTLLKLIDVKGTDGKTTLLHFVVQEIIRTEGARLCNADQTSPKLVNANDEAKCRKLGLQVVSCLSSELANVKNSADMDSEALTTEVAKLSTGLASILEVVSLNEKMGPLESSRKFSESMNKFIRIAEEEIIRVQAQESVALSLVKEITEYFHGNSAKEEAHPFRIFTVVRDFLAVLDRVCKEVGMINDRTVVTSGHRFPVPVNPMLPQILTGFQFRRNSSSSEGETSS